MSAPLVITVYGTPVREWHNMPRDEDAQVTALRLVYDAERGAA